MWYVAGECPLWPTWPTAMATHAHPISSSTDITSPIHVIHTHTHTHTHTHARARAKIVTLDDDMAACALAPQRLIHHTSVCPEK